MFTSKFCHLLASGAVIAGSIAAVAISEPAQADLLYTFDTFTGTGTPPAGPYGTVDLSQDGAMSMSRSHLPREKGSPIPGRARR